MIDYNEATERYNALLAELETANTRADENPNDSDLAATAQDAYDQAQAAYADVLAGYGDVEATEKPEAAGTPELQDAESVPETLAEERPSVESIDTGDRGVAADSQSVALEYDFGDFGTPATVAAPAFGDKVPDGVFILTRKPVATRFVPSETSMEELTPISRSLLGKRDRGQKSALSRERNIAGGLPEWSPMPPGEVLAVKRAGSKKK